MVRKNRTLWVLGVLIAFGMACVSGTRRSVQLTNDLPADLPKEMKDRFEIKEAIELKVPSPGPSPDISAETSKSKKKKKGKKGKEVAATPSPIPSEAPLVYPFRRPEKEAIWVSEKMVYTVSYLAMSAGDFTFEVLPYKVIDNRKVYHIRGSVVSSAVFSLFYRLNDVVESFLDYDGIFSHRFHLVLDETKQSRDSLELYDSVKKQTYYWNRWNHKVNGYKEIKEFNPIDPFSQDSVSALYYLRNLPLEPGQVVTFPVVSEGKSFEAVCTVERREMVDSPLGKVQALVIRPEMKVQGVIKKTGDSFLWLTDDDRKIPIRVEAKVRIGVVVAALKKVELGTPPSPIPSPPGPELTSKP